MDNPRWLFAVTVRDRPGTLTAVASVFSNRGVSIQMLLGSTLSAAAGAGISLFFVFESSERRMNALLRTMSRLDNVTSVTPHAYESEALRAVAFAHVDPRELSADDQLPAIATDHDVTFAPVVCDNAHETWILMARPARLDSCLARLGATGALIDATVTIIPVQ